MRLTGNFILIVNGSLMTYTDYDDIPKEFDHIIKFEPEVPPPPHTSEQHELIEKIGDMLKVLVDKEKLKYGNN